MINNVVPFSIMHSSEEELSTLQLLNTFKQLSVSLDNLADEHKKLLIIKQIEARLNARFSPPIRPIPIPCVPTNDYQQALLKLTYQFCMIFGFFDKAASSFLFGSNLFSAIPGLSHPTLLVLTSIYTLLDAILFYAFEISFLKEALGIEFVDDSSCELNKVYTEQLESVVRINIMLHRRETYDWDKADYDQYCQCMTELNTHLIRKQKTMKEYARSGLKMGIEYCVTAFGALSSIADSYFMAKTALLSLHVSFMGSPLGWAFVVCMVVSSLVFYYSMSVKSMSKLLNPDMQSYNTLKTDLTFFKTQHEHSVPYMPTPSTDSPSAWLQSA